MSSDNEKFTPEGAADWKAPDTTTGNSEKVNGEGREPKTEDITIYAVERNITTQDNMHKGYSTPLANPRTEVSYHWEGKLHGSRPDVIGSSYGNESLENVARSFASEYIRTKSTELQQKSESSYSLRFMPQYHQQKELQNKWGAECKVRTLSSEEQDKFMATFRAANQELSQQPQN